MSVLVKSVQFLFVICALFIYLRFKRLVPIFSSLSYVSTDTLILYI